MDDRGSLPELSPDSEELPLRKRAFELLGTLREPTNVEVIADQIECSVDDARDLFRFFGELRMAIHHPEPPEQFERNEGYFDWQYVTRLADTHMIEEFQQTIADLTEQRDTLQRQYDVGSPTELDTIYLENHPDLNPDVVWEVGQCG